MVPDPSHDDRAAGDAGIRGDVGAVILCGGKSRRMGRSKAWLPIGPEYLLPRVIRLVGESVGPIVAVAAPGQDLPPLPEAVRIVRDPVAGRGPLQGLAAGLAALPESVAFAYVSGTDAPFLAPGWIALLRERIGPHDLALPIAEGFPHPLAALYRRATCLPAIEGMLRADRRVLKHLADEVATIALAEGDLRAIDPALATLRNLNAPEDYEAAMGDLGA